MRKVCLMPFMSTNPMTPGYNLLQWQMLVRHDSNFFGFVFRKIEWLLKEILQFVNVPSAIKAIIITLDQQILNFC